MIGLGNAALKIFVALEPCDMRKSFNGLYEAAVAHLEERQLSREVLFVFTNKRRNRIKMIYYDGTGLWVAAKLIEDVLDSASLCPELLDPGSTAGRVFLWIGPAGTFTPAHHDLTNNLFLQVHGSKEFRLASSLALLELDNDRHCYLASSLFDNDERRRSQGAAPLSRTVTLEAGDALFLPLGWWHEVKGLSASVSVSATNFRARNDFHRDYDFYGTLA